jgi:hypothetical protein
MNPNVSGVPAGRGALGERSQSTPNGMRWIGTSMPLRRYDSAITLVDAIPAAYFR